MMVKDNGYLI